MPDLEVDEVLESMSEGVPPASLPRTAALPPQRNGGCPPLVVASA